jgi:undecaprenyl-diphosphatase
VYCLIGVVSLFGLLAWAVMAQASIAALDLQASIWLREHTGAAALRLLEMISALHTPRAILGWTGIAALVLLLRRDDAALVMLLLSVLGGASINHVLKHSFMRPRPGMDAMAAAASDFAFPSGHVANASLLYGALAAVIAARSIRADLRWGTAAFAAAMVALVAWSRVALGAHHVGDALGGVLLGLAWLIVCRPALRASRWPNWG